LDVKFPKNSPNSPSKILALGDWSKSKRGQETLEQLSKNVKDSDALVFLGDMAYDLDNQHGQVGNEFLKFIKEVTSTVPFQVILMF